MNSQKVYTHHTQKHEYSVSLSIDKQEITLKLEEKYSLYQWMGTYSKDYIENQITKKTGYPLEFETFCKIITKALERTDESCFVDILTSQDLQNLKAKKGQNKPALSKSNKRYIILTYMANDSRTHYPLPLSVSKQQNQPQKLKQLYKSLREQVDGHRFKNLNDSKSLSITYQKRNKGKDSLQTKEIDQLKSQNEILKSKLKRLQQPKINPNSEFEVIEARIKQLKESLQTPNMKLVDLRCGIQQQQQNHSNLRGELIELHQQISKLLVSQKQTKVRRHGQDVNKQLNTVKASVNKNNGEIQKLKQEVQKYKIKNKQLQQKSKKLTTERDVIKRGGRRGPYSTGTLSISSKASSYAGSVSSKRSTYSYNSQKYR